MAEGHIVVPYAETFGRWEHLVAIHLIQFKDLVFNFTTLEHLENLKYIQCETNLDSWQVDEEEQ